MIKIVFLGDIVGQSGRDAVFKYLPLIKENYKPDSILINGENAANGFGLTGKIAEEFFAAGVDAITLGNHSFDQKDLVPYISQSSKVIRPLNYPEATPGKGYTLLTLPQGYKILVINMIGRLFMELSDNPFFIIDHFLKSYSLGHTAHAILIDFHGEATSEKAAFAHYLDGRVSAVLGTHSHVPTADGRILEKGTGFQSDLGMCGNYNSVIGMNKEIAIKKFLSKAPTDRLRPEEGEGDICGVYLEINPKTGLCELLEPLRMGIKLSQTFR